MDSISLFEDADPADIEDAKGVYTGKLPAQLNVCKELAFMPLQSPRTGNGVSSLDARLEITSPNLKACQHSRVSPM
jgi:hypothetical protein